MCGIVAALGVADGPRRVSLALGRLTHRGPDGHAQWNDDTAALGHARLSIIDLSDAGTQPMASADGRYVLTFNGELYNYVELKRELADYPFRSQSDTEVVLAAWSTWGSACLDRFLGMFAFVLWDRVERTAYAVRDRFGVKPLYVANHPDGGIVIASEIKAVHATGIDAAPDAIAWASYLTHGLTDYSGRTFWHGVSAVPAGSLLVWRHGDRPEIRRWYDLAERVGDEYDARDEAIVIAEYRALLENSVALRFRSDVPVGINLSGGIDSSTLLALVHAVQGHDSDVQVFSFGSGDPAYDELPWVTEMLQQTRHELTPCMLSAAQVPDLAASIARFEDEPYGGLPTLAYANLFARARERGVIVLLDGQGMDEQWAGYDYYRRSLTDEPAPVVQGSVDPAVRAEAIAPEFAALAEPLLQNDRFSDRLRNVQLRDTLQTKIPRALRYNDRVSMAASTELREPFLDHRLFELALRQPPSRKIRGDSGKWLLRQLAANLIPDRVRHAPKRALQTPQREWLRGPLREWANDLIETTLSKRPDWFRPEVARAVWRDYQAGRGDNSFWVWQWLSIPWFA